VVERRVVMVVFSRREERFDGHRLRRGGRRIPRRCQSSTHDGAGERFSGHVLGDLLDRVSLVIVVVD